ncbi:MAG: hypothetical protein R2880_12620 [Deinococcales bacterium]
MMHTGYEIDQVFVKAKGVQTEIFCVFVAMTGGLKRETFLYPTRDAKEALRLLAWQLSGRGDVERLGKVRVRLEQQTHLQDAPQLRKHFIHHFRRYQAQDNDD